MNKTIIRTMLTVVVFMASVSFTAEKPTKALSKNNANRASSRLAKKAKRVESSVPKPTLSEVRYGEHERHVLDFWKADSPSPTPLVFVIHGGGWKGGSKERVGRFVDVEQLLAAGISVVAPNYRLIPRTAAAGTKPPVKAPLHDAARDGDNA